MRRPLLDARTRPARGHAAVAAATTALTLSMLGLLLAPRGRLRLLPEALRPDAATVLFVPASAHAAGANGASWRTDLQIHNPGTVTASFTIALLRRDADNGAPETRSYSVAPGQSVRHVDVLTALFGFTGAAALRLDVSTGTLTVTSRTYNQIGENPWSLPEGSSFGQFVPGFSVDAAVPYGEEGRLIQLTQRDAASLDGFRTNLGLVNATGAILDLKLDLYRADGTWLATKQGDELRLPPYGFRQLDQVFAPWGPLADAYAVVRPMTPGGRLFAFATVIDNHYSGDPIFIPAARVASVVPSPTATATPTPTVPGPTATPTRTPTATPTTPAGSLNLTVYKPADWSNCLIANYRDNCCPPSSELLSSYMDTWFFFPIANVGPARLTGPVSLALSIDGVQQATATWANDSGLDAGYYTTLKWQYKGTIPVGRHTATIKLDADNKVPETNETDNSCSFTGEWTSIVFRPEATAPGPAAGGFVVDEGLARPIASRAPASLAASSTVYLPASAHADGANGARWRTDVEVHNAGTSQATFTVAMLKQNSDNPSPETRSFTLGPQQSTRYVDVLSSVFGFNGAAALRFTSASSSLIVNSRTYNLIGANPWSLPEGSSFGQFVNGVAEEQAIATGEEGRLIQLTHRDASSLVDFRTNIGLVNVTGQTLDVRVDLFHANGSLMGTVTGDETRLRPYEFRQLNAVIGSYTSWCADGYAVVRPTTSGGKLLAFATVIDNHYSGDPVFIPSVKMTASTPPPTLTPTPPGPTATPTPPVAGLAIAITPAATTLAPLGRQSFRATVTGSTSTAVTWSVAEGAAGGSIDTQGSYTAPPTTGVFHVVATSQSDPARKAVATVVVSNTLVDTGCAPQPIVTPSATTESKSGTVAAGSKGSVALSDGTRVDVPAMPGPVTVSVTRAPGNVDVVRTAGQDPTGSPRTVEYGGDETSLDFVPTITIPAAEAGTITALNVARIGPVAIDGTIRENVVVFLPATRDTSGNVVVRDIHLRGAARLAPAATARAAPLGIVKKIRTIYNLSTYQAKLNWAIEPQLVRMVPDAGSAARRKPLSSLAQKDRDEVLRRPVQNVIVLVHGHNETERFGFEPAQTPDVWGYDYKRDAFTLLYESFQGSYAAYADCTAFYEFIYPTYRPVFDGAGSLGAALARMLGEDEKLKKETAKYNLLFVAHSMGGLVARSAINQLPSAVAPNFEKLVTWGSPHHGSPVVTFRYLLTSGYNLYVPGMCSTGSTLPLEAFNQLGVYGGTVQSEGAVDTPGERELRWDNSKPLNLDGIGWRRATWQEGDDTRWDPARNPDLYNSRLLSFNQSDKFTFSDKYVALYGLTTQLAPIDVTSCLGLVAFARSTQIPQGAGINRWAYNNGDRLTSYPGSPAVKESDGAVPVDSMVGLGVFSVFNTYSLGDTDHEQYYGAPRDGTLTARDKGLATAATTLYQLRLKDAPSKRCDCPTLAITGVQKTPPNATVNATLTWPGDSNPGRRVQSLSLVRLEGGNRVVVSASSPSIKDDGTLSGTFPQSSFEGLAEAPLFAATLKDGGEISVAALQMGTVTYTGDGKAGTIDDPPIPAFTVDAGIEAEVLKKLSQQATKSTWLVGSSGVNVDFNVWFNIRRLDPGTRFPVQICTDTRCVKYEYLGFLLGVSNVGGPVFGTRYEVKNLNEVLRIDKVTIGQGLTDPFGVDLGLWYKVRTTEWYTYDPAGTTRTREDELVQYVVTFAVSKE